MAEPEDPYAAGPNECPVCGYPLDDYLCRLACPNCGYQEDCSDTSTGGPMEEPGERKEGETRRQGDTETRKRGEADTSKTSKP